MPTRQPSPGTTRQRSRPAAVPGGPRHGRPTAPGGCALAGLDLMLRHSRTRCGLITRGTPVPHRSRATTTEPAHATAAAEDGAAAKQQIQRVDRRATTVPEARGAVTRVALVDDQALPRTGYRITLHAQQDMALVDEADNGVAASDLLQPTPADVVQMDVRMPHPDGVEATRLLQTTWASTPPRSSSRPPSTSTTTRSPRSKPEPADCGPARRRACPTALTGLTRPPASSEVKRAVARRPTHCAVEHVDSREPGNGHAHDGPVRRDLVAGGGLSEVAHFLGRRLQVPGQASLRRARHLATAVTPSEPQGNASCGGAGLSEGRPVSARRSASTSRQLTAAIRPRLNASAE